MQPWHHMKLLIPEEVLSIGMKEAGALWMKRMVGIYDKLVWLNPVPEEHWEYSASVELTRSLVEDNMFPLTIRGLEESTRRT